MHLTESDIHALIRDVASDFGHYVDQYEEKKYPPDELSRLRAAFAAPVRVTHSDIEAALVWKYGHTGKANYPDHQRQLARRIAAAWPAHAIQPGTPIGEAFHEWQALLGKTTFITVCFLLHLANPDTIPILDQHNFRSVNHHLKTPRPKAKPSRLEDLALVGTFNELILQHWAGADVGASPTASELDRYLMMHGKAIKR